MKVLSTNEPLSLMENVLTDRRFAIIIGINDYSSSPLQYCVKDALAVAQALLDKCAFKQEDILVITSEENAPIKDISGHLETAYKHIEDKLRPEEDSVFFYFAGHGEYYFEQSGLQFHDSLVEINSIFTRINDMQPKYQCYVIDACESGGKVLTRGRQESHAIEKFISKSSGILFMYAATQSETAKENEKLGHGIFTYYFLAAINNDELYDDGILTPNKIQDFIARETLRESRFKQTPVIENRTTGYYPFAFNNVSTTDAPVTPAQAQQPSELEVVRGADVKQSAIDKLYFPAIPAAIREQVLEELRPLLSELMTQVAQSFEGKGYEVISGDSTSIYESDVDDKITNSIVEKSRSEKVEAVNLLFSSDRRENRSNLIGTRSMLDAFIGTSQPKYTYYNNIRWYDDKLIPHVLYLKSNDIYRASCGLTLIIYQAVYGIGLASSSFYMDYTGYSDTQINGPFTVIKGFKIHGTTVELIRQRVEEQITQFRSQLVKWNTDRRRSISAFGDKSE